MAKLAAMAAAVGTLLGGASVASAWVVYPVDGDGAYTANLIRQYSETGVLTTVGGSGSESAVHLDEIIDGTPDTHNWDYVGPNPTTVGHTVRFTLDQAYDLKKFRTTYHPAGRYPLEYEILVSETGFGPGMTTAVARGAATSDEVDVLGSPVRGKYIEYTWYGNTGDHVQMHEFQAYAAGGGSYPEMTTNHGYNLTPAVSPTITDNTGNWIGPVSAAMDGDVTTAAGNGLRGNGTGDARFTVDLHDEYTLTAITLGFNAGYGSWANGVLVEILTSTGWQSVFDTHAAPVNNLEIPINLLDRDAQFIRVTNYGGDAVGFLHEMEVFAVPEPGAVAALGLAGAGMLTRRRRGA